MPRLVPSLVVLLVALAAPTALILAVPTEEAAPVDAVSSAADDSSEATVADPADGTRESSVDVATENETAEISEPQAGIPAESDEGIVERIPPVVEDEQAAPETPVVESEKAAAELTPPVEETTKPATLPAKPMAPAKSAAAPSDGKYRLQHQLKAGEVIRWEVVHRAVVDSTMQGTNQTAETCSTSVKMWKVTGVSADGQITLVHSVESIDMWQKTQGRAEVRYNSRTDDKVPPGYEEIATAVGVPLTEVTIDRHGEVLKREEKHRQSNTSNMPLAIPLPTEEVEVGYEWSVPSDVDVVLPGGSSRKIQTKQKFKLEKVSDGVATIAMETQVLTPLNDPAIEAQLVQRFTNGILKFDLERGRVLSQQLDLDRKVVGFSGASSSMHYVTRFTEELLPASTPPVAKKATLPSAVTAKALAPPSSAGTKKPTPPSAAAGVTKSGAPLAAAAKAATPPPATVAKKTGAPPANTAKAPAPPAVATVKKPIPPPATAPKKPTPPPAAAAKKPAAPPATAAKKLAPAPGPAGRSLKQPTSAWKPPGAPAQQPASAMKPKTPAALQPTR
jgi:hypothetical protein